MKQTVAQENVAKAKATFKAKMHQCSNIPDHAVFHMLSKEFRAMSKASARSCLQDFFDYSQNGEEYD